MSGVVAHFEITGAAGSVAAGTVGVVAAVRVGWREFMVTWRYNGANGVALGLMLGVPVAVLVAALLGTWVDGASIGSAVFVVGLVHGLDL